MTKFISNHKKFSAAVLASLLAGIGFLLGFSVEQVGIVVSPYGIFVVSQGVADIGKEKAKIEANGFPAARSRSSQNKAYPAAARSAGGQNKAD